MNSISKGLRKEIYAVISTGTAPTISAVLSKVVLDGTISIRNTFSKDSMLKAFVLMQLKGIKFIAKLEEYLKAKEDEALEIGFCKDTNNKVVIPDRRTFRYFKKRMSVFDKEMIKLVSDIIEETAHITNAVLDFDYVKTESKSNTSVGVGKRQQYNLSQTKAGDISRVLKRLLLKKLKKEQRYNSIYSKSELINLVLNTALYGTFTESGYRLSKADGNANVPTPETLFYYLEKYSADAIMRLMQDTLEIIISMAFNAGILSKRKKYTVCIDEHKIPYYGKERKYTVRKNYERGTTYCFEFITIDIREHVGRFTLAALPVFKDSDKKEQVKRLLEIASSLVKFDTVLMDRGFLDSDLIIMIEKMGLKMIIPSKKSNKGFLMGKHLNPPAFIKRVPMGSTFMNLAIVKDSKHNKMHGFFTNIDLSVGDPNAANFIASFYGGRWQIETGYRVKGEFRARTTSNKYIIRNFYFMMAVIIYNIWVIVNEIIILTFKVAAGKIQTFISAKILVKVLVAIESG